MVPNEWLPAAVAAFVALVSPLLFRPALRRFGVLDHPNVRSSHATATLRAGGIAQLLGALAALVVMVAVPLPDGGLWVAAVVLLGGLAAGGVGLADDLRGGGGLGVLVRAGLQLLIGVGVCAGLGAWWWLLPGALFFAAFVNMTNFMDGINGISGLHGVVIGLAQAATGLIAGLGWLVAVGLLVAAVFGAFLPWNLIGAGLFLGDVGSYLLGATIAGAALAAAAFGVPVVAVLAPLAIYAGDTLATIARRSARGEPILRAHRTHAYQRLTDTGLSHLAVAGVVATFTLLTGVVGLLVAMRRMPDLAGAGLILALVATYLLLPRVMGDRPAPSPRATLAAAPAPVAVAARPGFAPRRWVVVGASGFIGSAVVADLERHQLDVRGVAAPRLTLDPAACDGRSVDLLAGELPEADLLAEAFTGAEVVVNAAGLATPDAPDSPELYGANALLPAVIIAAARRAGVQRVVHLSSAAVQGHRPVLDATVDAAPFSAYSRSKALGERAVLAAARAAGAPCDVVIVRATSVQGAGRGTTDSLRRIAGSALASVAAPGTQPTVVSSLAGLVAFVRRVGAEPGPVPAIVLQPWEGLTTAEVIRLAGGREPRLLPLGLCRVVLGLGRAVGAVVPEVAGVVRRVELMWLGQRQAPDVLAAADADRSTEVVRVLAEGRS